MVALHQGAPLQVDGVGGIRLLKAGTSVDPDARGMTPPWAIGTRGTDQSERCGRRARKWYREQPASPTAAGAACSSLDRGGGSLART